jgi:transposase
MSVEQPIADMFPNEPVRERAADTEESIPKPRIRQVDRRQVMLRTVDVEKLIREDHPARAIWEFAGQLDLTKYYDKIEAVEGEAGRPAHDPRLLVSLWLYAYSTGVGKAREITRLCDYDPAYQWLTGMEVINYHTIADFRVQFKSELDELFENSLAVLSQEALIDMHRVMHDGTKIRASAGKDTFRTGERLAEHLEAAKKHLEEMGDPCADVDISKREAAARARAARERAERLKSALEQLKQLKTNKSGEEAEKARASETDPEARKMSQPDGGCAPSYNGQITADAAHSIIVGAHLSQSSSDSPQLCRSMDQVEANMNRSPDQVVTDQGFSSQANVLEMTRRGIDMIAPVPKVSTAAGQFERRGVTEEFRPDKFVYDPQANTFTCPAGKMLNHIGTTNRTRKGVIEYAYRAGRLDCKDCVFMDKCCPKSAPRKIVRSEKGPVLKQFEEKMQTEEAKAIYRQRPQVIEFCNAWIKEKIGLRQFHVRGLIKATMELLWVCMAYNVEQWIRLRWRPRLANVLA